MSTQQEMLYDPMNPYPWYRYMREAHPVHYSEQVKMWYVFRYEDVQHILADVQTFSSAGVQGESYIEASFGRMDPPRHGQYRMLVSQAFTPRSVALLEPRITAIVNGLLDAVAHTGRIELISELAFPLPAMIIMELFGVPAESREYLGKLSESFIQDVETNPGRMASVETQLVELLAPLIEARRSQPTDDLISRLLAAEAEGQKLSTRDILATCIVMLIAGHETTTRLIGNAMYCFTERPEVMAELRANPILIPAALEGYPAGRLQRAVVAQQLFDREGQPRGLGAQTRELVRVPQQREQAVADEVHRRVMAGIEQEDDRCEQLLVAQSRALFFRRDQSVEQRIARRAAALLDHILEVAPHRHVACERAFEAADRTAELHDVIGPLAKLVVSFGGQTEQLGDHARWQWIGEIVDEIEVISPNKVEELFRQLLDAWSQRRHRRRRERLADETAQPCVVRWIDE